VGTRQTDGQGFRDIAAILPVAIVLLLTPPLIRIFATPTTLGGIPLIVVYIFAVWATVILIAIVVARRTHQAPGLDPDPDERR
jgi:hypothetical protein